MRSAGEAGDKGSLYDGARMDVLRSATAKSPDWLHACMHDAAANFQTHQSFEVSEVWIAECSGWMIGAHLSMQGDI